MAVPTITSVSPTAGHTGGLTIVEIVGTNFRLPVAPAPVDNLTPEAPQSVRVRFDGIDATNVQVASDTLVYVSTPKHDPTAEPVDVTVENIDDDGNPIAGELATAAAVWRFVLPDLTDEDSDLTRLIRAFVAELARQITPNTLWPQHTDYDADTADTMSVTEVEDFPALIVAATELADNDFYAERSRVEVSDPNDPLGFVEMAPPVTVDILLTVVGVSDSSKELLNLSAATKRFFRKNPYLSMDRDVSDPTKGTVRYEMNAEDAPNVKLDVGASQANLRTFAITAKIVGFDIETMHEIRNPDGTPVRGPGGSTEGAIQLGKALDTDAVLTIAVED